MGEKLSIAIKLRCSLCFQKIACGNDLVGSSVICPSCNCKVRIPKPKYKLGTVINKFVLEQWLGKGAMAEVHLARQLDFDRLVAIKIIPKENLTDEEDRLRFVQEVKNLAKLKHPNIVTAIEAGEFDDGAYLAMSYIEGITVEEKINQQGAISEIEALKVCETIADALKHVWDTQKIIHRDLKPSNFMIDQKGDIFLMDLGIAKSADSKTSLTAVGIVMGTPFFMSPEQACGLELDFRSDVYSLGASLYNMVTGRPPFSDGSSSTDVMSVRIQRNPENPKKYKPNLSSEICALIKKMMDINPKKRPASWDEVKKLVANTKETIQNKKNTSNTKMRVLNLGREKFKNPVLMYGIIALAFIIILVIIILVVR